jgi:hypothetical protein
MESPALAMNPTPVFSALASCAIDPKMSTKDTHPYTLEVMPSKAKPGQWEWTIRQNGKLLQRSDRMHGSEKAARTSGMAEVERKLNGGDDRPSR